MKNITYIDASAGSGKTHELTKRLAEAIAEKKVRPDQVILTTFTVKAADDFRERAKQFLYERGLFEEAAMLDHALIGTVHSVANALVGKYWFHLGLAPDMGVMAEDDTAFYISQSLSDIATDEELRSLHHFVREFGLYRRYDESAERNVTDYDTMWKGDLQSIIKLATNYEISDFSESRKKSLGFISQFVSEDVRDCSREEIEEALEEYREKAAARKQSLANDKRIENIGKQIRYVNSGEELTINKLYEIAKVIDKEWSPKATALSERLSLIWHSRRVYDIQESYINLLFTLAERWQKRFIEFKKRKNVLDYDDMERYMLKLLQKPELADEIAKGYRYLFVDEYQDCSLIQVKIFDRLSELVEHSYWVGDYKQAIYGFRGADIKLTKSVVDRVATTEGCDTSTLGISYRSLPEIVDFCNDTFRQTFSSIDNLAPAHVILKAHRENNENTVALRYWDVRDKNGPTLAMHVADLIRKGVKPSDIAVLARENDPLDTMATKFAELGLPVNRENIDPSSSKAVTLVPAILRIIQSKWDVLAKAEVAFLTEKDYGVKRVIEDRLAGMDNDVSNADYLNDIPMVAKVLAMSDRLRQQSVSAMVSTVIIELDLYNIVKQWDDPTLSAACLDTFISSAKAYEEHCLHMGIGSSIEGFISYYGQAAPKCLGDPDGVQLLTIHKSKGLQWKYVIVSSLGHHPADKKKLVKRNIYGVHAVHDEEPTAENPFPGVYIRLVPYIYGLKDVPKDIQTFIEGGDTFAAVCRTELSESNRLLYVAMTRPSDVLILAVEKDKTPFQWFHDVGLTAAGAQPADGEQWDILGNGHPFRNCTLQLTGDDDLSYKAQDSDLLHKRIAYAAAPVDAPRRDIAPSGVKGSEKVKSHVNFGKRIPLAALGQRTMDEVGDCIHQIFCALDAHDCSEEYVNNVIRAYDMTAVLTCPDEIVEAWKRLTGWLTDTYGTPVNVFHERPFCHLREGQIYRGSIDLVWQTVDGDVLIDFKTCPLGVDTVLDPQSGHYAGLYAGQLDCYEHALTAAGETVRARLIYYPVNGSIAEL